MMEISQPAAWFVTVMLAEAAIIDGKKLKVPNWLTFHVALAGVAWAAWAWGTEGLGWSLTGLAVGLVLMLPVYLIGGMGAGDVKLMAAVGAWCGASITFGAFMVSSVVGAVIALVMILRSGEIRRHFGLARTILIEMYVLRSPAALSEIAAERKPSMLLLPYGIPIAIGSIAWFVWLGLLF